MNIPKWVWWAVGGLVAVYVFMPKATALPPLGPGDNDRKKLPPDDPRIVKHVVQLGESYSKIAKKYYGEESLWPFLYDQNKAKLGSNPDLIKVGQIVVVPPKDYIDANKLVFYRRRAQEYLTVWAKWTYSGGAGAPTLPSSVTATT